MCAVSRYRAAGASVDMVGRIASLDQFRGWAIFSMVLVNFLGEYRSMPETLRHHDWGLSYADVCVPAFLFAVGVAYRLTFLRRMRRDGIWAARWAAVKRNLVLLLVALFLYGSGHVIEGGVLPGLGRLCRASWARSPSRAFWRCRSSSAGRWCGW